MIWDQKAEFWDELHGDEGNRFHRFLVSPGVEKLLMLQPNERVLDVACGNGAMARRLSELGGQVTAVDFSPALIEKARARNQPSGHPITYDVVDATDRESLVALGKESFDVVVCTMALMDMPVIAPFYQAARDLLRPDGRLVIATAHPAFNSCNPIFYAEQEDRDGQLVTTTGVKISQYLDVSPTKGTGAPGEPTPHTYYHWPLHVLFGEAFKAGLVLDGVEEPAIDLEQYGASRSLSWSGVPQIPPVLVIRFRHQMRSRPE